MAPALAENAVQQVYSDTDETELIENYVRRRYRSVDREGLFRENKDLAAAYGRLRRAGFSSGNVVRVLKRFAADPSLLDTLEAGIVNERMNRPKKAPAPSADSISPESLELQIEKCGLPPAEFGALFGVEPETVRDWLAGRTGVPHWVQPALQIYELLGLAARRKFLTRPKPAPLPPPARTDAPVKPHPFSRLQDL